MAKSLRSKWRRKCRAVKRERYGKKELERLKKTLGIDDSTKTEVDMTEISEVATVNTAQEVKDKQKQKTAEANDDCDNEEEMDTDMASIKKKFNPKTLRDKNGAYPVWLHPRKIKKNAKKHKKNKKGKVVKK